MFAYDAPFTALVRVRVCLASLGEAVIDAERGHLPDVARRIHEARALLEAVERDVATVVENSY